MNEYIIELVKKEVRSAKDFSWVKFYERTDSYLIYNIEAHRFVIVFENYKFSISEDIDDELKFITQYDNLWDAVYYIRDNI